MKLFKPGLALATAASLTAMSGALAADQIDLRMLIWTANDAHLALFNEIASDYEASHPGVKVTYESVPYGEFPITLTTQIAGGNAPDLTWITETGASDFLAAGAMYPLSETFATTEGYDIGDYADLSIQSWSYEGEQYFYPFSTSPFAIFVNNDILKEAGQPTPAQLIEEGNWDWQHAMEIASGVAANTGKQGFIVRDFDYKAWNRLASIYKGWGAHDWSADGKTCGFDQPEMVDAMTFIHDAIFKQNAMPKPGVSADFFAGDGALTVTQISRASLLPKDDKAFDWDLVPLPAGPVGEYGYIGAAGIGVLKASKHAQEAADFLAFFSSKENVTKLARFFPPTRQSVLTPDVLAASNPLLNQRQLEDVVIFGVINGLSADKHANYEEITQNVRASLDALWSADANVAEVLQETCVKLTPLLQR